MKEKKYMLLPIFFTVFLDLLGLGMVIPVLPAVLFDPFGGILPISYSYSLRLFLYGMLTAAYPAAQFFGAPILGAMADAKGRKRLLIISLLGTLLGYMVFTAGILEGKLSLLFIGRLIDGFTGGNISIAQSAIADISSERTKTKNFGFVGMAFGMGFVIGPYIGGKLSDPEIVGWFNYSTPFFLSIILTLINIALAAWLFPETLQVRKIVRVKLLSGFENMRRAFGYKELRVILLVVFLLNMGHNFFTKFLQVFLMMKFDYGQSQIADLYGYMGLWVAASQGIVLRPLAKRYGPVSILSVSTVISAFIIPLILVPDNPSWLYLIIPLIALLQGMYPPNTAAIVSGLAGEDKQGEIFGINQSMQAVSQAIPPLVAGSISLSNINLPIIFAASATICAWAVFIMFCSGKQDIAVKY